MHNATKDETSYEDFWGRAVSGAGLSLLVLRLAPRLEPVFDLADDSENKPGHKDAQQRQPQAAQSHGHANCSRHPDGGRRGQSFNFMLFAELANRAAPDKADAGG